MQFIYIFLNMLSKVFKEVFKKFKELYGNSWKSALLQTKPNSPHCQLWVRSIEGSSLTKSCLTSRCRWKPEMPLCFRSGRSNMDRKEIDISC